ncbi:MAG: di-trans,poly-cis-decaprenylcistransferase [Deltaproteobacteria bacterium]|nr:di-trans,poly-cis-decaprenylcistransferase [Deltaproteobacteria bacterium]
MNTLPRHVGIIMDGNGRWARARGLDRSAGHERGVEAASLATRVALARGVEHLTLFAFSHSNWKRPKDEVDMLMRLAGDFAVQNRDEWCASGVRLQIIGDLEELPTRARHAIEGTIEATRSGKSLVLTLALDYGTRHDLVGAVRAIAARAHAGLLLPEEVDERLLRSQLTTGVVPDADLIVRTGGERRLSDFLMFESANAELVFLDDMWPDFTEAMFDDALAAYARRQRRFGRTSEQLATDGALASLG